MHIRIREVWVWPTVLVREHAATLPAELHVAIVDVLRDLDLKCTGVAACTRNFAMAILDMRS